MLESQVIEYPFAGGLEQKTDVLSLSPPALLTLTNCVRTKTGLYGKRHGFTALSNGVGVQGQTLTPAIPSPPVIRKMMPYRNELVMTDGLYLYSRVAGSATEWSAHDKVPGCSVTRRLFAESPAAAGNLMTDPDATYVNGYYCFAWNGAGQGLRLSVFDATTGAAVISNVQIYGVITGTTFSGYGGRVKCLAMGTKLIVVFDDPTLHALLYVSVDLSSPTPVVTTAATLVSDTLVVTFPTLVAWDAQADATGANFWVAYEGNGGPDDTLIRRYNASVVQQASVQFATGAAAGVASIGIKATTGGNLWLVWGGAGVTKYAVIQANNLTTVILAATTLDASHAFSLIGVEETSSTTAVVTSNQSQGGGRVYLVNTSGTVLTTVVLPLVSIMSRPWVNSSDGEVYAYAQLGSPVQATQFIVSIAKGAGSAFVALVGSVRPVATIAPRTTTTAAGPSNLRQVSSLPQRSPIPAALPTGNAWLLPAWVAVQADRLGLCQLKVDFTAPGLWQTVDANGALLFACGTPSSFDEGNLTELSFVQWPEGITTAQSVGGGSIANGTYQYIAVYAWTDAQGNTVRSPPSIAVTFTVTGGNNTVTLGVNPIAITNKQVVGNAFAGQVATPPNPVVEWYRTQAGPLTTFYFIGTTSNDPTVGAGALTFTDTFADNAIGTNRVLYTTGGVLENEAPPGLLSLVSHKERLFGIGEDGLTIWYTRQLVPGEGPAFHDILTIPIVDGVPLTALASMDDMLIAFGPDRILAITGEGPNDLGTGVDYVVNRISSDVGCIEPRSAVGLAQGIMFRSRLGLQMLTRARTVEWIGAPIVDALAAFPEITSAVRLEDQHQIRFTCVEATHTNGIVLVYDYHHDQWSTFELYDSVGAIAKRAPVAAATAAPVGSSAISFFWGTAAGAAFQEDTTGAVYTDGGTWITQTIESADVRAMVKQGFGRMRAASVIATNQTPHGLTISVALDHNPSTFNQVVTFTDSQVTAFTTPREQVRLHVAQQKGQAWRFKIQDVAPTVGAVGTGQGPLFQGLSLEFATKRGLQRLPAAQRA